MSDPVISCALGGFVVGAIEVIVLGGLGTSGWMALLGLFAGTGALVGAVLRATGAVVRRFELRRWRAAAVHGAPSLLVWIPMCATLFEGSFAAALPGAALGPYVLPLVLAAATVLAVLVEEWCRARAPRRGGALVSGLLVVAAVVLWCANRHPRYRFVFLDLHAGLTIAEIVLVGLAIRAISSRARLATRSFVPAGGMVAVLAVSLAFGLNETSDRKIVATRGDDARHLVRTWRSLLDIDGDGVSAALNGGDCDELDAGRNSGARDEPGNGKDEDCDGQDAPRAVVLRDAEAHSRDLAAWRAAPETPAQFATFAEFNVLLISVDALRSDLLAVGAPGRDDFPHLSTLIDGGVTFPWAVAPSAQTDVSLPTLVVGRWNPFQHVEATLIEAMKASGRRTGIVFPREALRTVPEPLFTRGADTVLRYDAKDGLRALLSGEITTRLAVEFVERSKEPPFFLWVHYFDVHESAQLSVDRLLSAVNHRGASALEHRYRSLLKNVDDQVGVLLEEVARRGLRDQTIVVLCSDHGESLGEQARLPRDHGVVVYQPIVAIPFTIVVPGVPPRVDLEPVSLIDLAPTLLSLTNAGVLPDSMASAEGADLVPNLLGAPDHLRRHDRALAMNADAQWAVIAWPWKLLVWRTENITELYNLEIDPEETNDLASSHGAKVLELRGRYGEIPGVPFDRSPASRRWRIEQAQPPQSR